GQLQQVVLNLCNNSAQAMDQRGRIEVGTKVHQVTQVRPLIHGDLVPGRYVRISVSDTGRGMDDEMLERIFEPFFTTRLAGSGLGLATVREIVREHGGAINVSSTPGVGSRFEVWLPCIAVSTPVKDDRPSVFTFRRGETVLMVAEAKERHLA